MPSLETYRGRDFLGVEELASVAASLIERYSAEPERGNVRLTITPRIVRHYLSEELLGEPTGQSGTSTVFNYGNLLRLLAVKKLLADRWSVMKIKEFMTALDITALEQLVTDAHTLSQDDPRKSQSLPPNMLERTAQARTRYVEEIAGGGMQATTPHYPAPVSFLSTPPPPLASLAVESARRAENTSVEWIEIAPGLEIKVRRSFRPPRNEQEHERLTARFWSVIQDKNG